MLFGVEYDFSLLLAWDFDDLPLVILQLIFCHFVVQTLRFCPFQSKTIVSNVLDNYAQNSGQQYPCACLTEEAEK